MRVTRFSSLLAASALLLAGGCYTASSTSRTWGEAGYRGGNERRGEVETIRESVDRQVGDPAGGALAGALIGGILTGRPGGALVGAFFGAAASQGTVERRYYEVLVRYDDGARQSFTFAGPPPFQIGDRVVVDDRGIFRD